MAKYTFLIKSILISWITISCGQETDPVARMHSPYAPEHPGSIPDDDPVEVGKQYIEYLKGTMPLILVVPHGGKQESAIVQDRTSGCFDGACVFKHNCGEIDAIR